ncbi:MAG: MarR family winged helix-turn-helix transcriptional regulator [Ilumatobacteraceae bacterium]
MAVKWLNDDEMLAWRSFIETSGDLLRAIERDLAPFDLDRGDYQLLAMLSDADEGQLRLCDLADMLRLSPSGLTRRIEGVVKKKLVTKTRSTEDRRVTYAQITPKGWETLKRAAPHHLRSVRSLMIDHLTPSEIKALGSAFSKIEAHLNSQC